MFGKIVRYRTAGAFTSGAGGQDLERLSEFPGKSSRKRQAIEARCTRHGLKRL